MYRLIFGILSILPWWAYAVIAVGLANATYSLWDGHQSKVAEAEALIRQGPPPLQKLDVINRVVPSTAFPEVRIAGFVRADLGVGRLEGTVPKSYFVVDGGSGEGPLLAVMFVGSDAQVGLSDLIATADAAGLVEVNGLRRTLDWAEVSGQLRLKGVRREVLLVEAFVGSRADVLRDKATSDVLFVYILGGLAGLSALTAFYRRNRAQSRKRLQQPPTTAPSAPPPAPPRPAPKPQAETPWARETVTRAATFNDPPPEDLGDKTPAFESVFPGNAGGFRFKSADEIIRETFGTVTALEKPKSDE